MRKYINAPTFRERFRLIKRDLFSAAASDSWRARWPFTVAASSSHFIRRPRCECEKSDNCRKEKKNSFTEGWLVLEVCCVSVIVSNRQRRERNTVRRQRGWLNIGPAIKLPHWLVKTALGFIRSTTDSGQLDIDDKTSGLTTSQLYTTHFLDRACARRQRETSSDYPSFCGSNIAFNPQANLNVW